MNTNIPDNSSVDWASHYDIYETKYRAQYQTTALYQNDSHFERVKHFVKKINNNTNLIAAEIGFGSGVTLRYYAPLFKQVYGLDISPKNVELTQMELKNEGITNVELTTQNILEKNDAFKNKFDLISYIHGLEHFSDSDFPVFFENIKYYLKPGGYFTGALPNNKDFVYRICPHCECEYEIDGHLSRHTFQSLKQLFEKHQFKIYELDTFNLHYYKKSAPLYKTMYHKIKHDWLKKEYNKGGQLEFIVGI